MNSKTRGMKQSFDDSLEALANMIESALSRLDVHQTDDSNPHKVNKVQVGLGNLPNAITARRDIDDRNILLTAKAMCDHIRGADHDDRYIPKEEVLQQLNNKASVDDWVEHEKQLEEFTYKIDEIIKFVGADTFDVPTVVKVVDYINVNLKTLERLNVNSIVGLSSALEMRVKKEKGKQLTTEDFTTSFKDKLTGIEKGAEKNVGTILSVGIVEDGIVLVSSTGNSIIIPFATSDTLGLMSIEDKRKLDGIDTGAEINPKTTGSRDNASLLTVLQAKAMYDHVRSRDHDNRYYCREEMDLIINDIRTKMEVKKISEELFTTTLKDKLNKVEDHAQKNVPTNLSLAGTGNSLTITSSTGRDVKLPLASIKHSGMITREMFNKLIDVEEGAQKNVPTNLNRTLTPTSMTIVNSSGENVTIPTVTAKTAGLMSSEMYDKFMSLDGGRKDCGSVDIIIEGTGDSKQLKLSNSKRLTPLLLATSSDAGLLSIRDKIKLDKIEARAQRNVETNLSMSHRPQSIEISSSTGNYISLPIATRVRCGLMSAALAKKIMLIEDNAQRNVDTILTCNVNERTVTIRSSTGNEIEIPVATPTTAGLMSVETQKVIKALKDELRVLQRKLFSQSTEINQLKHAIHAKVDK